MRRPLITGAVLSICILFVLLPVSLVFTSAAPMEISSESDLVIGEDDEGIVISGPEYAVKGNIIVQENGVLEIRNTYFEIYQEHSNQFEIELENSATLKLIDSTLVSEKEIDLTLGTGSVIEIKNSTVELPGEIKGTTENVNVQGSEMKVQNVDLESTDILTVEDSIIESDNALISSPDVYLNRSVFHTELIFHGESMARSYGSLFENIEINAGSEAHIYGKVSLSVRDKIDVPIGDADVIVERAGFENWMYNNETDENGEWLTYLLAEEIESDRSFFKGNYDIRVEHEGFEEKRTISLSPVEKRTPERERKEFEKEVDIRLLGILPPTSYYFDSEDDLEIDGDEEHIIDTYPNKGVENHIQQGNIFLTEQGNLAIGEESSVKVLQSEERYRVEMKDNSELHIKNNGSLGSDRPLNIYLYDDSSLHLYGAELNVGSVYLGDSSSLTAVDTHVDAEDIYFEGYRFEVKDSVLDAGSLEVKGTDVDLQRSKINTDRNVSLEADSYHVTDLDFERAVFFKSETKEEISITNVTAEEIIPREDLRINKRWYLRLEIFNGEDRLVPSVELNIYRQRGLNRKLSENIFVEDGRIEVPLKSEVITSKGSRFEGNYILEANKSVNDEVVTSETTRVALDSNVKTELRFIEEFPYSIVIDVDLPDRVDPGEIFEVEGRAVYEGVDLEVANASVEIIIDENDDLHWNTTTDETGQFDLEVRAPDVIRTSSLDLRVHDEDMMMESEITHLLEIREDDELSVREFLFATTLGRFISITIIFVLLILAYKIMTTPLDKGEPSISTSDNMVNWTEKSLKKE